MDGCPITTQIHQVLPTIESGFTHAITKINQNQHSMTQS